jgi:penicillin-binding protein 1A
VLDDMGPSVSYRFVRDMLGFDLDAEDENYAALAAGQLNIGATVREMTSAFTMFPNAGVRVDLRSYTRIYDADGVLFFDNEPRYTRAISDVTAYWMTDMLHDAATGGTGRVADLGEAMPTAGKTGTSSDYKDRWFIGFTPYYIAAVWTGYDTPYTMSSSNNPAAQIWKMIMEPIHADLAYRDFSRPRDVTQTPVPGIEAVPFVVRCVDLQGGIIFEETLEGVTDMETKVTAPSFEGYVLIGDPERVVTLTTDLSRNVIVFLYESDAVIDPTPTDDPWPTDDPGPTDEPPDDPIYPFD